MHGLVRIIFLAKQTTSSHSTINTHFLDLERASDLRSLDLSDKVFVSFSPFLIKCLVDVMGSHQQIDLKWSINCTDRNECLYVFLVRFLC
jgi:hypothetical protein